MHQREFSFSEDVFNYTFSCLLYMLLNVTSSLVIFFLLFCYVIQLYNPIFTKFQSIKNHIQNFISTPHPSAAWRSTSSSSISYCLEINITGFLASPRWIETTIHKLIEETLQIKILDFSSM